MNRRLRKAATATTDAAKETLDALTQYLAEIKVRTDQAKDERTEAAPRLMEAMKAAGVKRHRVPWSEEHDVVAAIKERSTATINAEKLKKALGAKQFHRLTTPHLDESKVEAAIQLGEVDQNVVAQCTEESSTEYIDVRFQKKKRS